MPPKLLEKVPVSEPEVEITEPEPEPVMEEKLSPEPILVNTTFLKRLFFSLTSFLSDTHGSV